MKTYKFEEIVEKIYSERYLILNPELEHITKNGFLKEIVTRAIELYLNDKWNNNEIQFARLLCEMIAVIDSLKHYEWRMEVATSMDLMIKDVNEILNRAEEVWEKAKSHSLHGESVTTP